MLRSILLATFALLASYHAATPSRSSSPASILVFTKTAGFRHASMPDAVDALRRLGADAGVAVVHTEDAGAFTAANLTRYRVVVFASTTGDVLDDAQQSALRGFVEGGGGFVGLHAAADTEYDWPWYRTLVGAWFLRHPPGLQTARVTFADDGIAQVGRTWRVTDEFYDYRDNPRPRVRVVATLDERDYAGGTMGADHPIAWCHAVGRGRSWYTGLGHEATLYRDPTYLRHVARGLRFALGIDRRC